MEQHEAQQKGLVQSQRGSLQEAPSSLLSGVQGRLKQREIAAQQSRQDLLTMLNHPQWEIRSAAIRALGEPGKEAPLEPLIGALQDEHRLVRVAAVRALGQLKERVPIEQLLLALRDEEWEVREVTVLILGTLSNTPVELLLRAALHDSNGSVREAAQYALSQHNETFLQRGNEKQQRFCPPTIAISTRAHVQKSLFHLWSVFSVQASLLNRSTWITPILAMTVASIITFFLHADAGWSLTVATLSVSATGAAYLYGSENDAGMELALSTPTSPRTILLSRLAVVLCYNVMLATLASVIIVLGHGEGLWMLIHLWLGPALFLSSFSLALSLLFGSLFASLAALLLTLSQVIQVGLEKPFFIIQTANLNTTLWQLHPVLLSVIALGGLAFAVLCVPRYPRLAH